MGNLTWTQVVLVGAVAAVGFSLLSWWYATVMAKRGWMLQAKNRAKDTKREPPPR